MFARLFIAVACLGALPAWGQTPIASEPAHWEQSRFGGGGYVTGLIYDPKNPDILYARTDVAGVFKSTDGGEHWRTINNGMTERHHHAVQSIAISPFDSRVLLRASGDSRDGTIFGTIHKSTDGGESWRAVCDQVGFYGNGPDRPSAEVLQFSPTDPNIAVAGGFIGGLWISRDQGDTWTYGNFKNERIGCVLFHPTHPGWLYVCTLADGGQRGFSGHDDPASLAKRLADLGDTPRGNVGKIYLSRDNGCTWETLAYFDATGILALVIDRENPDIMLFASNRGIYRSTDAGRTFLPCTSGLPGDQLFNTISADPSHPSTFYCGLNRGSGIPIFRSTDAGESWHRLKDHYTRGDLSEFPAYITKPDTIASAVSRIVVDPRDSNTIYISNYFGVSKSRDGGLTWTGHNFDGIETTCVESVMCDPQVADRAYVTIDDHKIAGTENGGKSFAPMDATPNGGVCVCVSRNHRGLLLAGIGHKYNNPASIWRSEDGGKSGRAVRTFKAENYIESIVEDDREPGTFFAFVEGPIDDSPNSGGIYRSGDWGKTWTKTADPLAKGRTIPADPKLIDDNLFIIVVYQHKNVFGTERMLACDPAKPRTVFMGDWTAGLFRSEDGGNSWRNIGEKLPFEKTPCSVLRCLRTDDAHPGVVYAGFMREGLWRSTDEGQTWAKIFPEDDRDMNVTDLALGRNGEQLVVASEPLHETTCKPAIYLSGDRGATWKDISDPKLGAPVWHGVAIDQHTGRLYAWTAGNGIYFTDLNSN